MKLNLKISFLIAFGTLVISVVFCLFSVLALKISQTQNINLFKEEFLALGQDLFDNSSKLFFSTLDNKLKTSSSSSASLIELIQGIDPGNSNLIIYSISQKKFLLNPSDIQTNRLVNEEIIEKDMQANTLNLQTIFDIDNFQAFAKDSTISPTKIELRFYNDLGLIIGYQKPFTIGKIRIDYLQSKNDQLYNSYLLAILGIASIGLIVSISVIIFMMRMIVIKPLISLTQGAKEFGKGKMDVIVNIKSKDEIGELATVFNQMTKQLNENYTELENKVKERTKELERAKTFLEQSLSDSNDLQVVLKKERDRAKGIIVSMGEGLFVIDKNMKLLSMNPASERLLEIKSQDAIGKNIVDVVTILKDGKEISSQDRPAAKTLSGASMNIGTEDNYSFKLISGKEFSVSISTTPLRGERGINGVVEVFHDITSEKRSRAAIEQEVVQRTKELLEKNNALILAKEEISKVSTQIQMEKARLIASVNSISLGFLMFDAKGEILIKNPAIERMVDIGSGHLNIELIDQLLGKDFSLKEKFNKCIEEKSPINDKNINFNDKYFRLFMAPIFSADNTLTIIGVVVLIQDETEAKTLDRSKDEFFSIASHELRTPLTAIRGNTSLIQEYFGEKIKAEPELVEMIEDIHASSIRLIQIVNDFLNVSRLEQGKLEYKIENFDLAELIDKKIKEINSLCLEKNIPIVFEKPATPLPGAYADKDRVGEVLLNLMGNAIKYSEKGRVDVNVSSEHNSLKVSVSDSGKGVPFEQQNLLFKKFQQASNNILTRDTTRATGLGLYISKLMIEQMKGKIFLEKSTPGVGSVFSFTIPATTGN